MHNYPDDGTDRRSSQRQCRAIYRTSMRCQQECTRRSDDRKVVAFHLRLPSICISHKSHGEFVMPAEGMRLEQTDRVIWTRFEAGARGISRILAIQGIGGTLARRAQRHAGREQGKSTAATAAPGRLAAGSWPSPSSLTVRIQLIGTVTMIPRLSARFV
jgi:hypothetical protein